MAPNNSPLTNTSTLSKKVNEIDTKRKEKEKEKEKEKNNIMKELDIDNSTYTEAAVQAEKMLNALRHTYITEKVKEMKIARSAKQADQERITHEIKLMKQAEENRVAILHEREKSVILKYRITMSMLILYVFGSSVFITTIFTDFITIKELGVAFHQMMMGIF